MSRLFIVIAAVLMPELPAQEVRVGGPPPEIRALIDATVQAVNGTDADWEAFAQAKFAPALLKQRTPEERARMHQQLKADFGVVTLNGVRRQGPGAPLLLQVKGEKEVGVIELELEPAPGAPAARPLRGGVEDAPRIAAIRVRLGDAPGDPDAAGVPPLPPLAPSLTSAEIEKRLDGYFTRLAADDVFSGVALVAKDGVPVFLKAYGYADREKKVANTVRTRFNVGSINKTFTQAAIRQLVQAGKLSLTDTLGKFFPDYPQAASRAATVEQLLTHRAGLADFFGPDFSRAPKSRFASNADYFTFVSTLPPLFAPGERSQYCNGCYIALGAIVSKVAGMPYEKYVAENVFARAEMTSTGYPRSDQPALDIALGYTRRGPGSSLARNTDMHGLTGSAAGGGYSTALDLLTYVKAIRAGKFPGADQGMGIAGGAPGISAVVEARREWTVIVLANFDPPIGERIGVALADALTR